MSLKIKHVASAVAIAALLGLSAAGVNPRSMSFEERMNVLDKGVPKIDGVPDRGLTAPTSDGLIPWVRLDAWAEAMKPSNGKEAKSLKAFVTSDRPELRYIALKAIALSEKLELPAEVSLYHAFQKVGTREFQRLVSTIEDEDGGGK